MNVKKDLRSEVNPKSWTTNWKWFIFINQLSYCYVFWMIQSVSPGHQFPVTVFSAYKPPRPCVFFIGIPCTTAMKWGMKAAVKWDALGKDFFVVVCFFKIIHPCNIIWIRTDLMYRKGNADHILQTGWTAVWWLQQHYPYLPLSRWRMCHSQLWLRMHWLCCSHLATATSYRKWKWSVFFIMYLLL